MSEKDPYTLNEADTRAEYIDPQLAAAGWGVVEGSRIRREYYIRNPDKIHPSGRKEYYKTDYLLIYKNRNLAVVEAKPYGEVEEGVPQAKRDGQKLHLQTAYSADGKEVYEICLKTGKEGSVPAFPTPDELWHKTFGDVNEWQNKFNAVPLDVGATKQVRYYQEIAINKAVEAIANNKPRILLTLATGTGKTFIAAQIAWKLFNARWTLQRDGKRTPRILFLADRNTLASQAIGDFEALFGEEALARIKPEAIKKNGAVPTNASVFFTIFQTFKSGDKGKPYFGQYPPDFFDFVIIDECHRGGANDESSWREILEHFSPAVQLGLTATPKREDNVDTYAYFGEPIYKYSLKEGVDDGFLTPFRVRRIQTTLDEYIYANDDEVLEGEVETDRIYKEKDFNNNIEIEARERKRVEEMLAAINPNEKTIVFCANQAHAAKIRDLINQTSDSTHPDYCVRVTSQDKKIGDTHLKIFQDNEKAIPTILTTSHKLSTGVDARNIRNIVLMRPINSMIEFKQIIGRGTRLFEGKYYFTIVDFVSAYHHFSDPEWDGDPIEPDLTDAPPDDDSPPDNNPPDDEGDKTPRPQKVKIKLSDGKEREIQSMSSTQFWLDGKLVGVEEYLKKIFDILKLPEFFDSEDKLKELWADPTTRRELLKKLADAGCAKDDLVKLQEMINAKDSDLFDVLEYISYARTPITRRERVAKAESNIYAFLTKEEGEFIAFVLENYIKDGVDELDDGKLGELITLKYKSNPDAERVFGGNLDKIRPLFINFQRHLYLDKVG